MQISLRPHHFLCLRGYKGLNYSKSQNLYWMNLHDFLNKNPKTDIQIITGKDDLCSQCPAQFANGKSFCKDKVVEMLDEKISQILGLCAGKTYKYSDILNNIKKYMTVQKHQELCSECAWWKKGLCRDSFEKTNPPDV